MPNGTHRNLQLLILYKYSYITFYSFQLDENGSLTPEKLSQLANVSVLLARERLFATERLGMACRDESIEGLAFYPNMFLNKA